MATIYQKENEDRKYDFDYYEYKIRYERDMKNPFCIDRITTTYCLAYFEVRLVDIIFLNPNNFETKAFELKLKDWKGVLHQAKKNLESYNHSSIVMPYYFLKMKWDVIKADVEETNIGVYGVKEGWFKKGWHPTTHEFKPAKKTKSKNLKHKKVIDDHYWLKWYDPTFRKYSGGFIQMYEKTNTYRLF